MSPAAVVAALLLIPLIQDKQQEPVKVEMGKAQLVFLVDAKKPPKLNREAKNLLLQKQLHTIRTLWSTRKALLVGNIMDGGARKSILVLDVPSAEDAKQIMAEDPAVKGGLQEVECHTWFFAKNYVKRAPEYMDVNQFWFCTLERGENLPKLPEDELQKLQDGHMANIQKMAAEKSLLLAGPMVENTPLRGIFIFKPMPKDNVIALTSVDPLIKSGRLKLKLYKWIAAKGSFLLESPN